MATAATHDASVPIQGYDGLKTRPLIAQLRLRSQAELTEIDRYERSHQDRGAVLDKVRYLRDREPIEGYDQLDADEVAPALADADSATLSAARSYEVKMRNRQPVVDAIAKLRNKGAPAEGADPADRWPGDSGGGFLGGASTVGVFVLVGIAAVLALVSLAMLLFVVLTVVAPESLFGS